MAQKVSDYLAKQQQAAGITAQTAAYYAAFEELYTKKLWHQLTLKLLAFIAEERPANLVELYENFIVDFESRIKHLSLVEIASNVVAQIPATEEKLKFIEKIKGRSVRGRSGISLHLTNLPSTFLQQKKSRTTSSRRSSATSSPGS